MDYDEKLIRDALFFLSLRSESSDGYEDALIYLRAGADVNAVDGNDYGNTPLHIAVERGNVDLVQLLLSYKPDVTVKNDKNKNPLELAETLPKSEDIQSIIHVLQKYENVINFSLLSLNTQDNNENVYYPKSEDTSGVPGELNESKLLSFILFRSLHDEEITHFYLGTNRDLIGEWDDVSLKYLLKNNPKPGILFLQAKHIDNDKGTINISDLQCPLSPFSLIKYFKSYEKIKSMFQKQSEDVLFRGEFDDAMHSDFVIFTPSKSVIEEKYIKRLVEVEHRFERFFPPSISYHDIFQVTDIDLLLEPFVMQRIDSLGELLKSAFVTNNQKSYSYLMSNALILRYHVVLAEQVINVSNEVKEEKYRECTFRTDFLEATDNLRSSLRKKIFEDVTPDGSKTFKVPSAFGNIDLTLKGKKTKRMKNFVEGLTKLIRTARNSETNVLKIEKRGIAASLGHLLVFDNESNTFKFNDSKYLTENSMIFFGDLQRLIGNENILQKYRIVISTDDFPTDVLGCDERDKYLAREFLSKLWFFTNQPKQHEIEDVLTKEIKQKLGNFSVFRTHPSVTVSVFHDKVQKWWMEQNNRSNYKTIKCDYFEKSVKDIFKSPMMSVLDFFVTNKIKKNLYTFNEQAVQLLGSILNDFFNRCPEKVLYLTTSATYLTMNKLVQFKHMYKNGNIAFLDLCHIINEDEYTLLNLEVQEPIFNILIFLHKRKNDVTQLCRILNTVCEKSEKKVIVVSEINISDEISSQCNVNIIHKNDEFESSYMCMHCNTNVKSELSMDLEAAQYIRENYFTRALQGSGPVDSECSGSGPSGYPPPAPFDDGWGERMPPPSSPIEMLDIDYKKWTAAFKSKYTL